MNEPPLFYLCDIRKIMHQIEKKFFIYLCLFFAKKYLLSQVCEMIHENLLKFHDDLELFYIIESNFYECKLKYLEFRKKYLK